MHADDLKRAGDLMAAAARDLIEATYVGEMTPEDRDRLDDAVKDWSVASSPSTKSGGSEA